MKRTLNKWAGLLLLPFLAIGCYPSPELSVSDLDVIITSFEKAHDFGADQTFSVADSVFVIETESSIDLDDQFDDDILELIITNLQSRGYTYIAPDDVMSGTDVDFFIVAAKNGRETSGTIVGCGGGYYPGYPWYPGGGWWGPGWGWCYPYYGSYSFEQGSLLIAMLHEDFSEGTNLSGPWFAAINGILGTSKEVTLARITNNINRAFDQSPYLKAN